ncbi:hypothetical protein [Fictibacillus enclensis]|nr:hypothetical protein [Fictibacillus enclensis]WHY72687.1 hypothetical protein QNH15_01740 [Fictibacillus enclensis]
MILSSWSVISAVAANFPVLLTGRMTASEAGIIVVPLVAVI